MQRQSLSLEPKPDAGATPADATALAAVDRYYTDRLRRFGSTPLGVDWPNRPNQELRFAQLVKVCDFSAPVALNDIGCGYGALRGFLSRRHRGATIDYVGTDVSAAMVAAARRRWRHRSDCRFDVAANATRAADYSLASGVFNVKLDCPTADWEALVARALDNLLVHSRRGFAVNFIHPAGAGQTSPSQLYRPSAQRWSDHLMARGDCAVAVLRGYGLPEYTLLVRPHA